MTILRRNLFGLALAASVLSTRLLASSPTSGLSADSKDGKNNGRRIFDVIVIGSGAAGLAAAISAKEAGASDVLIVEKMPVIGGNTLLSSGVFNAPDSSLQKPFGIEDSTDLFFEQTYEAGRRKGRPELIRILVDEALPTKHWLEKQGIQFQNKPFQVYGGLWPRSYYPTISHGRGYVAVLSERCVKLGIPIRTETEVTDLLKDKTGRVTGVIAQENGRELRLTARRGVVIASGGFSANEKLCSELDPRLKGLPYTGAKSATGEMLFVAERVGAKLVDMSEIQCNLGPKIGHAHRSGFHLNVTSYILVNKEGRRFVAEDGARDVIRDAVFAQPDGEVFSIVDNDGFQTMSALFQQASMMGIRTSDTFRGRTIADMAKAMGVPPAALEETVAQYNRAVDEKRDPVGREPWMLVRRIERPPFYAAKVQMCVHFTMGGIAIDEEARVLDASDKVIPGLYAAGEATGGIHGANRVGGNALVGAFVFGRIAGENAARENASDEDRMVKTGGDS